MQLKINRYGRQVDLVLFGMLVMQPVLDILSFFMIEVGMTTVTTMLRMAIFAAVTLYAFWLSDHKKPYFVMAGVLAAYFVLHAVACFWEGYESIFQDVALFVRTIQMPVFALCFITFFQKGAQIDRVIQRAFVWIYVIISASILLSYLVGRPEYTYYPNIGIKGWFAIGNAQSCIISLLAPLALYYGYQSGSRLKFAAIALLAFANMYFFGTKVALYFLYITIVGFLFFMILGRSKNFFVYGFLLVCLVVSVAAYKQSPCYENQYKMGDSMSQWETEIGEIIETMPSKPTDPTDPSGEEEKPGQDEVRAEYEAIYSLYTKDLVDRYGLERVVEKYNYSIHAYDLINNRNLKVNFSSLAMDEKNFMTHLFGFEYVDFIYEGRVYDPENDYPAVYFSNGYVGLAMYIAFLAGFALLILRQLLEDFKGSLTLENGMVAITFILILGAAQLSGNVLRRPNVSIFLSLILAYIYYLCVIKRKKR